MQNLKMLLNAKYFKNYYVYSKLHLTATTW